jgi:tRNA/rRNA methyltransferase
LSLHLVLVEPLGARNVGSVARLCANFAITQLRLVAPRCDPLSAEARQMAVHGGAYLEHALICSDLGVALADCRRVVAATGRLEGAPLPLEPPEEALAWLLAGAPDPTPPSTAPLSTAAIASVQTSFAPLSSADGAAALVFGREDRGLSNDELLRADRLLHIPAAATYPSLNLSHAVAVALHHLWVLRQSPHRRPDGTPTSPGPSAPTAPNANQDPLALRSASEAALADAEALLLEVGFLLPHTARARMAKLRALLRRAQPTEKEVALLRGMVCQLRWASRRGVAMEEDH